MALKLHLKLDGNGNDSSGNGHNASLNSSIFTNGRVAPVASGALYGGGFNVADHEDINPNNLDSGISVSAWIKLKDNGTILFENYLSGYNNGFGYSFGISPNGKMNITLGAGEELHPEYFFEGNTALPLNQWLHLTWTAIVGGATVKFYINGVLDASDSGPMTYAKNYTGASSNYIAQYSHSLDDLKLYNHELSQSEITAEYEAGRDSSPAIYTLRASDGDFSTWNTMALMIQSLGNINEDITIRLQGGQSFGADGSANEFLTGAGQAANDKILLIETDPSELATPATVVGAIRHNAWPTAQLKLKKFKHRCNIGADVDGIVKCVKISAEDIYAAYQINSTVGPFNDLASGADTKNCTFAITFSYSGAHTFQLGQYTRRADNCLMLFYDSANDITLLGLNSDSRNCLAYNYAGSKTVVLGGGSMTDLLIANPQLVGGNLITAYNEAPATILARNAHLQSSSPCCGSAYVLGATATDIEGKSRA